jgi:hypothetical protein
MGSSSFLLKILGIIVPAIAILLSLAQFELWPSSVWPFQASLSSSNASSSNTSSSDKSSVNTTDSAPKIIKLSDDPVIVYIKDFLTTEEAIHLVGLT